MIETIKQEVERRGITRLCHFTPSRNLVHILTGTTGILATKKLQTDHYSQVKLKALLSMSKITHLLPVYPIKI